MAVVMDYIAKTGARIVVKDDAYAGVSDEEMARRWKNVEEIAQRMAVNNELRRLEQEALENAEK